MFKVNGVPVKVERFPDGTPRLNIAVVVPEATIEWLYEKDEEMIMYFIAKHLREKFVLKRLDLYVPYLPHARMDRAENKEEVFTLKYFCELINSLNFDKVIVRDVHSKASLDLLRNVVQEDITQVLKELACRLLDPKKDIVFFPDEGSRKRYSQMFEFPSAYGVKKRDWNTGRIITLDVQGNVPAQPFNVLIMDDICSYGGTFLFSAEKLKELGAEKIYLYVTHCENSILKGELISSGLLERIFTTKSIFTEKHPLIEIIGGDVYE